MTLLTDTAFALFWIAWIIMAVSVWRHDVRKNKRHDDIIRRLSDGT